MSHVMIGLAVAGALALPWLIRHEWRDRHPTERRCPRCKQVKR